MYFAPTILALLGILSATVALPEPQTQSSNNTLNLEARKAETDFIYNMVPPKGKCRLSSYISKINHVTDWRVVSFDGTFISRGQCSGLLCTSPLLGLGDSIAVIQINNAQWKYEYMRSGTVSDDRWLSTDTSRCMMSPEKPIGDASVTVTCDFDCTQKYPWPLEGQIKGSTVVMKTETADSEVAAPLVLPSGLTAPTSAPTS